MDHEPVLISTEVLVEVAHSECGFAVSLKQATHTSGVSTQLAYLVVETRERLSADPPCKLRGQREHSLRIRAQPACVLGKLIQAAVASLLLCAACNPSQVGRIELAKLLPCRF